MSKNNTLWLNNKEDIIGYHKTLENINYATKLSLHVKKKKVQHAVFVLIYC